MVGVDQQGQQLMTCLHFLHIYILQVLGLHNSGLEMRLCRRFLPFRWQGIVVVLW
ncbi:unnamed protein product [Rodentolepis nana]|uniref:Uncharacterized protein n=1 Tax=Rodentolepis nana TaxID=102285 RepID=A0A0R3T8H4_RODNA|nr:unnamed protein product [Rodentolepis nana]